MTIGEIVKQLLSSDPNLIQKGSTQAPTVTAVRRAIDAAAAEFKRQLTEEVARLSAEIEAVESVENITNTYVTEEIVDPELEEMRIVISELINELTQNGFEFQSEIIHNYIDKYEIGSI